MLNVGSVKVASTKWLLTGNSIGNFTSGLDESITATLAMGGSFAYVGPLFAPGSIEAIELNEEFPGNLPSTIEFRSEPGVGVAGLCLRHAGVTKLYLPSKSDASNERWVEVPRTAEFYAMSSHDRNTQRNAWIDALSKVKVDGRPDDIDFSKHGLGMLSAPALRVLLAYVAAHVCAVTGVNQPRDGYRGGQTRGFTMPLLHYPISEPDCYIRVISGREGLLESINAYDLGAGISLGSIQFNVHRAAIFQFLRAFFEADPDLFEECFGRFGWLPSSFAVGGHNFPSLEIAASNGNKIQLVGRDADHSRNCGYFQSGIPGNDAFDQIDPAFRKSLAAAFRDAVIWPHVQEQVMHISSGWLLPGLLSIEAAGIPPVDPMRPDRDTFVLKALLLSSYVRYSACLAPLLKALKPYASSAAKLGAIKGVLLSADSWSSCSRNRRSKLAARLEAQKPDAVEAWEVINRLADSRSMVAAITSRELSEADDCDVDTSLLPIDAQFWDVQAAALTELGNVGERLLSLISKQGSRQSHRKASVKTARTVGRRVKPISTGDFVVRMKRNGRTDIAFVDGVDEDYLYVRTVKGAYKRWGKRDAGDRTQVLALSKTLARQVTELQEELVFTDATLAVPVFSDEERCTITLPILDQNANEAASAWNRQMHPIVSGLGLDRIANTLQSYVDFAPLKHEIAATYGAAAANFEAVLAEAIHQFQRKIFASAEQHDGRCGESTLDNLGIYLGRRGFNEMDVANPVAQAHLHSINKKLGAATDNPIAPATLNATNWFRHMTAPAFLGHTFSNGIHAVLLRRLRAAERYLLGLPAYSGLTPVKLGRVLGVEEFHRGSRPASTTGSMHTFGLATDISYTGNPWIRGRGIVQVLQRAHLMISGLALGGESIAASFLHAKLARKSTAEIFDFLWKLDRDFRSYLSLRDDDQELSRILEDHGRRGTRGVFNPGETLDAAVSRWRNMVSLDLIHLSSDDSFVGRDPRNGFLNLARDLVIALRDFGCLAWGASDFGPRASGDIMHFDCRNTGLGRIINKGFAPLQRKCP